MSKLQNYRFIYVVLIITLLLSACATAPAGQQMDEGTIPVVDGTPAPENELTPSAEAESNTTTMQGFTVVDAKGREVTFETPPEKIVVAGRAVLIVADAMYVFPEASQRITAISKISQGQGNFTKAIDPLFDQKTEIELNIGPEQVAAFQPDLVILKSFMEENLGKPLETLGIPVVYVDFENPEQYYRDFEVLGKIFNNDTRKEEVVNFYKGKTDKIITALPQLSEDKKPKVLLLYYSDSDGEIAFNIPPASYMQTILVTMAGGNPVWKDAELGNGWTKVTFEQIATWDPDQIHIVSYFVKSEDVVAGLKQDPNWVGLRAVSDNNIFAFPADFYSWDQPDTRWILGLTYLAAKFYPESFTDLVMMDELRAFYKALYGMNDEDIERLILPVLQGDLP